MKEIVEVLEYKLYSDLDGDSETAGKMVVLLNDDEGPLDLDIWYDADGDHYICYPTGEEDDEGEDVIQDMLLADVISYCNPKDVTGG